mgnify:CR=1 FL=1
MHFMTTVKDIHRHEANDDHDKSLGVLFDPQSVAIIGASDDTSRIGGRSVLYLKNYGFLGSIYPVNLNRAHIQGLQAYSSVELIPGEVSLAIVALPANAVHMRTSASSTAKCTTQRPNSNSRSRGLRSRRYCSTASSTVCLVRLFFSSKVAIGRPLMNRHRSSARRGAARRCCRRAGA